MLFSTLNHVVAFGLNPATRKLKLQVILLQTGAGGCARHLPTFHPKILFQPLARCAGLKALPYQPPALMSSVVAFAFPFNKL